MSKVYFKRKTTSEIEELPIVDGSFIIDTETGKMYTDVGTERIQISGGGSGVGDTEPIGSTKIYFGTTEPSGYKFANGQALSRTEYADLFNLIGTTYGTGNGSTTFNLPDMSGRVPVGLNVNKEWFNQLGKTGGSEEVTLTNAQTPEHQHYTINAAIGDGTTGDISGYLWGNGADWGKQPVTKSGGGQAHTNLQPYITVNYIMKVKNITSTPVESNVIGANDTPNDTDVYSSITTKKMAGGILLWTNSSPEQSFEPQTVNIDLNDYDMVGVVAKTHTTQTYSNLFMVPKICGSVNISFANNSNTLDRIATVTNSGISFTKGRLNADTDNERCIPLYIIGYKTGLFNDAQNG